MILPKYLHILKGAVTHWTLLLCVASYLRCTEITLTRIAFMSLLRCNSDLHLLIMHLSFYLIVYTTHARRKHFVFLLIKLITHCTASTHSIIITVFLCPGEDNSPQLSLVTDSQLSLLICGLQ